MATLNEKMQLARDLFGREPAPGEVRAYATATADSNDGTVSVNVGGEVIDVPVIGAVARGQEVVLQVQNGHPVAIGAKGWGDSIKTELEAVTSYVWQDSNGAVHVTAEPESQQPDTGVTINAEGVEIEGPRSYVVAKGDGVTVGANGADALIISSNSGAGGYLIGSPIVALTATPVLSSSASSSVQLELNYLTLSQVGTLLGVRGAATSYEAALTHAQHAGPSATELTRVLDLNPSDSMASAVKAKYLEADALKLGGSWLSDSGWVDLTTGVKYRAAFGFCTIAAQGLYYTDATSGWKIIASLPATIRPSQTLRFVGWNLTAGAPFRGQVTRDGLSLHQRGRANDQMEFTITYPVG